MAVLSDSSFDQGEVAAQVTDTQVYLLDMPVATHPVVVLGKVTIVNDCKANNNAGEGYCASINGKNSCTGTGSDSNSRLACLDACENIDGTQIINVACGCGTTKCTTTTGLFCAASRNQCTILAATCTGG